MGIRKRLYFLLALIFLVHLIGSVGYYIIFEGEPEFLDCLYMTVVSLTTVGYGEVLEVTGNDTAQIFTMVLITFGMGIILYGLSSLTALFLEGELSGLLRKKRMAKQIDRLKDHYIVCGGGQTGSGVLTELCKNNQVAVLIEEDPERIERCKEICELLFIQGDATDDENLFAAGIERAAGIVITLPSDKDTLYVTMTARMLNNDLRIVSRMTNQLLEPKLIKAGADGVVCPNAIGALRMASKFNQKEIRACGLKQRYGLLVLGSKGVDREIEFNPPPEQVLTAGMTLIVMGSVGEIARAKNAFQK
jgi:voltage-gated potassium channel